MPLVLLPFQFNAHPLSFTIRLSKALVRADSIVCTTKLSEIIDAGVLCVEVLKPVVVDTVGSAVFQTRQHSSISQLLGLLEKKRDRRGMEVRVKYKKNRQSPASGSGPTDDTWLLNGSPRLTVL